MNFKNKRNWIIILLIILIFTRFFHHSSVKKNEVSIDETKLGSVLVEKVKLEEIDAKIELSGHIESKNSIKLIPQTDGIVKEIFITQGNKVKSGDVILALDEKDKLAEFNRASQLVKQKKLELDINNKLLKSGDTTIVANNQAKTNFDDAMSQLERAKKSLSFTKVTSPIDGYLDKLTVKVGDYLNPAGMTNGIANIFNDKNFIAVFSVPQNKMSLISNGQKALINFDNKEVTGVVDFLSSIAETGTRTYYGEVKLENSQNDLLLKMIGAPVQVKIIFDKVKAIKLKDSSVYIDDNGVLNAKIIDQNKLVQTISVNMLESDNNGITWFSSPEFKNQDEIDIIVRGAGFLNSGEELKNIVYMKSS